jgi:myo-inositol-1(or 4)-monophosphatase
MTIPSTHDLKNMLVSAEAIARSAGALLREAYDQPHRINTKDTSINLVTQADLASEKIIITALHEQFPGHAILSEEGGGGGSAGGLTWLIDPLDGTTNFAHAFPVFAVSMALSDAQGPLLGVVYDPLREECFTAIRGQGATLNGQPVRTAATPQLRQALIATGFPYDRHTAQDNNVAAFAAFIRRAQGVRRAGAAAIDLCYVACGRLDGYWEMNLGAWDVAAGSLIVCEAGGRVTDYADRPGSEDLLRGKRIVASNGHIHAEMIGTLREVYAGMEAGSTSPGA